MSEEKTPITDTELFQIVELWENLRSCLITTGDTMDLLRIDELVAEVRQARQGVRVVDEISAAYAMGVATLQALLAVAEGRASFEQAAAAVAVTPEALDLFRTRARAAGARVLANGGTSAPADDDVFAPLDGSGLFEPLCARCARPAGGDRERRQVTIARGGSSPFSVEVLLCWPCAEKLADYVGVGLPR